MTDARAVIAAIVVLLGVTACSGDDPEPKVAPSSPVTSEPSDPSTSPVASPLSPEETVRAWVDAQNVAMATGDSTKVRALAAEKCETCDGLVDPVDEVFAAGGHFETDGWRVDRAKVIRTSDQKAVVHAAVTIAGGRTVTSAGADPVVYQVDRSVLVFKLDDSDSGWKVSFIGFLS